MTVVKLTVPGESVGKLCECGCGELSPIARRTSERYGHAKGQPIRFINGHQRRQSAAEHAARFWSKVDVRGTGECWPWTAGTFRLSQRALAAEYGVAQGTISRVIRGASW